MSTGKIIFYAPVGNGIKSHKSGGAEAGCKKTMEVLKKGGFEIILVEKPTRKSKSIFHGGLLVLELLLVWLKLIYIFIRNPNSIFHIAGFYLKQVTYEKFFLKTALFFSIKTVYEVRNGGMIESYDEGTEFYKKELQYIFENSSLILCQGYEYKLFLKERFGVQSSYYPNYLMDEFVRKENLNNRDNSRINLIYFGRVVPDKNVDFILEICNELTHRNVNFHIDIIGGYDDDYYERLDSIVVNYDLQNKVIFHGRQDFNEIYNFLSGAHFFIFPSKEKREGQSNSLTEAMGCGVVPIASPAGFNRSIINEEDLILNQFSSKDYADQILKIWSTGNWLKYSNKMYSRVLENYTESVVSKLLLMAYSTIK